MAIWNFLLYNISQKKRSILLYVLDSKGSSPGRRGFVMVVNENGLFKGTIGGGIMEVKMIELAKSQIQRKVDTVLVKKQYHDKARTKNQSGLICSGSQTVALIPINKSDEPFIHSIANRAQAISLIVDKTGLHALANYSGSSKAEKEDFAYKITIPNPKRIHIFGAGHVGIALARQMKLLGYQILQYDDRPNLPILKQEVGKAIKIINYQTLSNTLEYEPTDLVVILSFSYRSDKLILKELYQKKFAFIGMMGSEHKIATLRQELAAEGVTAKDLAPVFMPIGLNMYSKTAPEIAVSIAAQIIFESNKKLPTGRSYQR